MAFSQDLKSLIEQYAVEDARNASKILRDSGLDARFKGYMTVGYEEKDSNDVFDVTVFFIIEGKRYQIGLEYMSDSMNNIYQNYTPDEMANELKAAILEKVSSSESVKSESVTADTIIAADDDEDFMEEDSGLDETLDEMADNIEDLQDDVEDIDKQDDPSIETDNNLDNHLIAECDGCHGVFISAILESDQKIDHVSGICPLCEKETDQYLKWVIKPLEQ